MIPDSPTPTPQSKVIAVDPATGDDHTAYAIVEHKEGTLRVLHTGDLLDARLLVADSTDIINGRPSDVSVSSSCWLPDPSAYGQSDVPSPMDAAKRKRLRAERKRRNAIAKASRRRNRRK